jgi:AcrR family transcriptional regulator
MQTNTQSVRDRILGAARELFLTKGYNGSNLRDIAGASEVSMGGIYHHFDSKEDIYKALLSDHEMVAHIGPIAALFRAPEFPENLGHIGAEIFRMVRANKDFFKLLYIDVLEFQGANVTPTIKGLRDVMTAASEGFLAARFEAGQLADLHPAVVLRCLADLFIFSYLEEVMLEKSWSEQLGLTDEELAEQMARILLYGIMKRPE